MIKVGVTKVTVVSWRLVAQAKKNKERLKSLKARKKLMGMGYQGSISKFQNHLLAPTAQS